MTHDLKILPAYFDAVMSGDKMFEIRDNSDRGFQKGDIVVLREFDPNYRNSLSGNYTGREAAIRITYVTGFEQKPGWVVFGFCFDGEDTKPPNNKLSGPCKK